MENVSVNVDTLVVIKAFNFFYNAFEPYAMKQNSLSLRTILEYIRLILVCAVLRIIFLYAIITTMKTFFYCICRQKMSTSAWKFDKNNVRFV